MQRHFASVLTLHDAAARGDVAESRRLAEAIAARPGADGIAERLQPQVAALQASARHVTANSTLKDVAESTAAMLAACGDCHRAAGVMPAPPPLASPAVGGVVGHMLGHERAIDLMVQGLTVPSTTSWNEGAVALATAPLRPKDLPKDPQLTKSIRAAETRVLELAEQAPGASDAQARIHIYSELIQSCASCHTLHQKVWGPRRH